MSGLKPLTEAETTELLDWVSACQSSYHIDSTPGHRFGGLGSHLQENRESLVEYVNELIAARAQPAQAGQVLTLDEVRESVHEAGLDWHNGWTMGEDAENRYLNLCRAIEQAVLAKRVPMTEAQIASIYIDWDAKAGSTFADLMRAVERHHGIVGEKGVA